MNKATIPKDPDEAMDYQDCRTPDDSPSDPGDITPQMAARMKAFEAEKAARAKAGAK